MANKIYFLLHQVINGILFIKLKLYSNKKLTKLDFKES